MFCYLETRDSVKASFEHLLSRPVAEAFDIDRTAMIARIGTGSQDIRWARLNGIKRKCVCTNCNNGWMNELEHAMKSVARWAFGSSDEPMGVERDLVLRKWALKTHFLLHFIDGNAGNFLQDPKGAVVPPFSAARRMYDGDDEFVRSECVVGLSRSSGTPEFAWAFGDPTIENPPAPGIAKFAPVSLVTIGRLGLWVSTPQLHTPESVTAPPGVVPSAPSLKPSALAQTKGRPSPRAMVVRYPPD